MSCSVTEIEVKNSKSGKKVDFIILTNIIVLKVFEQRYLSDGGTGRALFVLQSDFFKGHQVVG